MLNVWLADPVYLPTPRIVSLADVLALVLTTESALVVTTVNCSVAPSLSVRRFNAKEASVSVTVNAGSCSVPS